MNRRAEPIPPKSTPSEPTRGRIVLASSSPRRQAILAALGVDFESADAGIDELPTEDEEPDLLARRLAHAKATAVARRWPGRIVLGADTVVSLDATALGKPRDCRHGHRDAALSPRS